MPDWREDIGDALAGLKADVGLDVPLAGYTTFGIGGPADMLVTVHDRKALAGVLAACRESGVDWWVLGRGSNVLVSDSGLRGVVVMLGREFGYVKVEDSVLVAGAGAGLDDIAVAAEKAGLRGAEFLAGIPGTVGGGLRTNAGAFDRSLTDVLSKVRVLGRTGRTRTLKKGDFETGYRQPVVDDRLVVIEAELELEPGYPEPVETVRQKRWAKQPQDPSAGSFFRNPESEPAGSLIDKAGLKGFRVGKAQVSEKHANFIINTGGASFFDVYELAQVVKAKVEEMSGIELEEEVQVLPEPERAGGSQAPTRGKDKGQRNKD
ncbi:MAG: UDP-N-acetylmuramate dehydrogenase [candidate division WOR-3 bacterium]|nr:MAG: UDP-N-acetylmuramate dehydrogenase [candidate division WOR-3 bacterium]